MDGKTLPVNLNSTLGIIWQTTVRIVVSVVYLFFAWDFIAYADRPWHQFVGRLMIFFFVAWLGATYKLRFITMFTFPILDIVSEILKKLVKGIGTLLGYTAKGVQVFLGLGILFVIGVIIFAIIKWSFGIVF